MAIFLSLTLLYSCNDRFEENLEIVNSTAPSSTEFVVKSLKEINNPLLSNQLKVTEKHLRQIISRDFDDLLIEHNVDNLFLGTEHIVITENADNTTSYSLFIIVPQENGEEWLKLNGYLTLYFDSKENLNNTLEIGYQFEYRINFDKDGTLVQDSNYGRYTPKPSNIASKAPKYIVCQYVYCGYGGWSGSYGPAPQWVLDQFPWLQTEFDVDDLTLLTKMWYETDFTETPFSQYNGALKSDYTTFYDRERMDYYYGGQKTYWNNFDPKPLGWHVHKKAFIDSFQRWIYKSLDPANANTTYTYLTQNHDVLRQVFNVFADINLTAATEDGVYLEVPYGGYSSDPNVRCVNQASAYLLTPDGLDLLRDLGDGTITLQDFIDALPGCD